MQHNYTMLFAVVAVLLQFLVGYTTGQGCITRVWLYAQTADEDSAGSDNDKTDLSYSFKPEPGNIVYHLYDNQGNDMDRNKGTVWNWDRPSGSCVTVSDFKAMQLYSTGSDTWKVDTLTTYVELDSDPTNKFYMMTNDFSVKGAVGSSILPPDDKINMHDDYVLHDTAAIADLCIYRVTISISTGDDSSASGKDHGFQFKQGDSWGTIKSFYKHDHASDMSKSQSDMWIYQMTDFFPGQSCVKFGSITGAQLKAQSIYGWQVKHAFVNVELDGGWALLAAQLNINKWLDSNQGGSGHTANIGVTMRNKQPTPDSYVSNNVSLPVAPRIRFRPRRPNGGRGNRRKLIDYYRIRG